MITDAQVHLWEASSAKWPWAEGAKAHLAEPMTAERMLALMDAAGVGRAIISPLMLTDWAPDYALDVAARYPERFKVMGWFWPERHQTYDRLARWLDDPRMCSMRLLIWTPELLATMTGEGMAPFWGALERHGIPVAFMLQDNDAKAMAPVARRHPGLKLIVDHMNWPITAESRERKMADLEALSVHPNVYLKVSSLPRFATGLEPYQDVHPMIRRVHAAFGARRLMWGSDQSQIIARDLCGYTEHVDIIRVGAARYLPPDDVAWILSGTASAVFSWA